MICAICVTHVVETLAAASCYQLVPLVNRKHVPFPMCAPDPIPYPWHVCHPRVTCATLVPHRAPLSCLVLHACSDQQPRRHRCQPGRAGCTGPPCGCVCPLEYHPGSGRQRQRGSDWGLQCQSTHAGVALGGQQRQRAHQSTSHAPLQCVGPVPAVDVRFERKGVGRGQRGVAGRALAASTAHPLLCVWRVHLLSCLLQCPPPPPHPYHYLHFFCGVAWRWAWEGVGLGIAE